MEQRNDLLDGEDLLMGGAPMLDGWVESMFADSPVPSPPNIPTTTTAVGEQLSGLATAAVQQTASAPDVTMTDATVSSGDAVSNVAPVIVTTSSTVSASSFPAASPSAALLSPLMHAHIAAESSPVEESPSDEDAPTGTAIGDDEDAELSASSGSEEEAPRKRRSSGHVHMDISDDDSAIGYEAEEYDAATGRKRFAREEWMERVHSNGQRMRSCGLLCVGMY